MLFDGFGEAADAFSYEFGSGVGEVEAHVARAFGGFVVVDVPCIKRIAGDEGDILLEGGLEHGFDIETRGESYPEK